MKISATTRLTLFTYFLPTVLVLGQPQCVKAQLDSAGGLRQPVADQHLAARNAKSRAVPPQYRQVQRRLAQGWNTWDVNSVTTHVLLPEGLAIHVGLRHNTANGSGGFLGDTLEGRRTPDAEQIFHGQHSWDGSYTDLRLSWKDHAWRIQSAHDGKHLVLLASPLQSEFESTIPPTIVFSVNFLWGRPGTAMDRAGFIETHGESGTVPIFCTCSDSQTLQNSTGRSDVPAPQTADLSVHAPYFSADFTGSVGVSTGKPRSLAEIEAILRRQQGAHQESVPGGPVATILNAIQTTLGWNTIYDPVNRRVITPVGREWSVASGGFVLFEWNTMFTATMAATGDRDLAYANVVEILRGETPQGFIPNYTRALTGDQVTYDRSQPPIGSLTLLGLYEKFHDHWLLEEAFQPLLRWNRWWPAHRDIHGYLAWGSHGDNLPLDLIDKARGMRQGAIYESGMDNSPMYAGAVYNPSTGLLEFADVGLMSMYVADCDSLAKIARILGKSAE